MYQEQWSVETAPSNQLLANQTLTPQPITLSEFLHLKTLPYLQPSEA